VLGVDGDALAGGEFAEVDAMAAVVETEFDAAVFEALTFEAVANAEFVHELDGGVFEKASADALFDVGAGVEFEDDGLDAETVEEEREEEAGGAGADDGYLGAHLRKKDTPMMGAEANYGEGICHRGIEGREFRRRSCWDCSGVM